MDLGTSSLSPRQRTSSTHTTSKTQTRNTLATPIRVVLPDKLDVFHPYDLLETMEVDTKTVGLSFVSKPTDVRSTRHLLLKTVEEKIETQHWIDKKDFILIALGASTGLGNIWDLPHTASVYGGGEGVPGIQALFGCVENAWFWVKLSQHQGVSKMLEREDEE